MCQLWLAGFFLLIPFSPSGGVVLQKCRAFVSAGNKGGLGGFIKLSSKALRFSRLEFGCKRFIRSPPKLEVPLHKFLTSLHSFGEIRHVNSVSLKHFSHCALSNINSMNSFPCARIDELLLFREYFFNTIQGGFKPFFILLYFTFELPIDRIPKSKREPSGHAQESHLKIIFPRAAVHLKIARRKASDKILSVMLRVLQRRGANS